MTCNCGCNDDKPGIVGRRGWVVRGLIAVAVVAAMIVFALAAPKKGEAHKDAAARSGPLAGGNP